MDELFVDPVSNLCDVVHPLAFATKHRDADTPLYHEAMKGPYRDGHRDAMRKEIEQLEEKETWKVVPRPKYAKVIPGTWAFRAKRFSHGQLRKLKARFCVRRDKQEAGVDYFETYAPMVSWTMIRMMTTLSIVMGLKTKQVDYTNAFAQAEL